MTKREEWDSIVRLTKGGYRPGGHQHTIRAVAEVVEAARAAVSGEAAEDRFATLREPWDRLVAALTALEEEV